MKALILAAGFGTRLAPYTDHLPKPLFTLNNSTLLDMAIEKLIHAGCNKIFINTHHLAEQIIDHINSHPERTLLEPLYEPKILDTGGAISNLKEQLKDSDFLVVNADITHNLDLSALIHHHRASNALATLAVHDCPRFNKVRISPKGAVEGFDGTPTESLAFTGIQMLSPEILDHLPPKKIFSSIEVYNRLSSSGRIMAYPVQKLFWQDIGTVDTYRETARYSLAGNLFNLKPAQYGEMNIIPLAGDGSDREWFRADWKGSSLVISDHNICIDNRDRLSQMTAFIRIGNHLERKGLNSPKILGHDRVSGQVALEDLGNTHLADKVAESSEKEMTALYKKVIDHLISFSQKGIAGFDPQWTCQTTTYSKKMILDLECRYFLDAFIRGYLGKEISWENLEPGFSHIAEQATGKGPMGLMHRDFQSKNIMLQGDDIFFIDFQSARIGPLEYDLASLLIDPYVTLPQGIQEHLLAYCILQLKTDPAFNESQFRQRYQFCCITRNLQMLGAFGFLYRVKNKPWFEAFIPAALAGLKNRITALANGPAAPLYKLVTTL